MKLISFLNGLGCCANLGISPKAIAIVAAFIGANSFAVQAQAYLEIEHKKLFGAHTTTLNSFQKINIKTKQGEKLKHLVITGFSDSAFVFKDHKPLAFSATKRITLLADRPLASLFGKFFRRFGIAFFGLNTLNQAITGHTPVFQVQALYIGGGIYSLGLVLKAFENKQIRVRSHTQFKTIAVNYSEINR